MNGSHRRFLAAMGAFYLRQQRFDGARNLLEVLYLLETNNPTYRLTLAYCLLQLAEYRRVISLLEPLLRTPQYMPLAGRLHCRALWASGHHGAARALMVRYGLVKGARS